MSLEEQIAWFQTLGNEQAMGYDDSGCFWRLHWGPRGCGSMMRGFGHRFLSDSDDLGEALDELRAWLDRVDPVSSSTEESR